MELSAKTAQRPEARAGHAHPTAGGEKKAFLLILLAEVYKFRDSLGNLYEVDSIQKWFCLLHLS